jgi:hypothetical protein
VGSLAGGGLVPSYIPRLHVGVKRYDVTTLFLDDFKVRPRHIDMKRDSWTSGLVR